MFRVKKLLFPILLSFFLLAAVPAQAFWPFDQIGEFFRTDNGQTKTDDLYATNMNSQYKLLYGCSFSELQSKTCVKTQPFGAVPSLLASSMSISSTLPAVRDANGDYLASLIPFPQAHADRLTPADLQKTGTQRLVPVLEFWSFTRNIAYVLMIGILIVIGFMIMFRRQIDPRTTVTATAALPRIVLALVLITFSWPIAGLLMDVGNILLAVISNQLNGFNFVQAGLTTKEIQNGLINNYGTNFDFGEWTINAPVGLVIGWITFLSTMLLVFTLAVRWLTLFLMTILAPLSFMVSAIPGQEGIATGWFKSFMINVLVFPVTYFIINFGYWLASTGIQISGPPAFYSGTQLGGIMLIAVLIIATRIPAMLEQAFDALPSGHVQRSGVDPYSLARKMPIVGGFF